MDQGLGGGHLDVHGRAQVLGSAYACRAEGTTGPDDQVEGKAIQPHEEEAGPCTQATRQDPPRRQVKASAKA